VLIRHHSRFLKVQKTETFRTRQEAIEYAEKYEKSLTETNNGPIPFVSTKVLPEWTTLSMLIKDYQKEVQSYKQKSTTASQKFIINFGKGGLGNYQSPLLVPR